MCLHSVKADGKQMGSTADGALDPWSCFTSTFLNFHLMLVGLSERPSGTRQSFSCFFMQPYDPGPVVCPGGHLRTQPNKN